MNVKYKQEHAYGCGMYAVANTLNLDDFVTEARLQESKKGNNIGKLAKWMQEDGKPYYIDVLWFDYYGSKLPELQTHYRPVGDEIDLLLPVLLNVRTSEKSLNHLVGGKIDQYGTFYLYDSLKSEVIITTLSEINDLYETIFGLYCFNSVETADYVFIQ
jgi:hypothetical protein